MVEQGQYLQLVERNCAGGPAGHWASDAPRHGFPALGFSYPKVVRGTGVIIIEIFHFGKKE